eukprot:comp21324_c0_seq1/m.45810 comp21324_c0_seq1/g.45810  ORF comp21324_c0_seq1/g.45810 comp21324_c0_seq1/m.45810 type:complete len:218 (+) comp21324_c0_seq1:65-718(+)
MISVHGPRLIPSTSQSVAKYSPNGVFHCEFKVCSFGSEANEMGTTELDEAKARIIESTIAPSIQLHHYPKATIDVSVLVMEDNGGALAAAVCGVSLALCDAGIELFDLVASAAAGVVGASGSGRSGGAMAQGSSAKQGVLLDPERGETVTGEMMLAMMPARKEITQVSSEGMFSQSEMAEAVQLTIDACHRIHELMTKTLSSVVAKAAQKSSKAGKE